MTATIADPVERELWNSMPGWGIAADLTPPEIGSKRRMKILRKLLFVGLVGFVALCAVISVLSMLSARSAEESLARAEDRTAQLQAAQRSFQPVITSQARTRALDGQLAQLMAQDVDVARFVGALGSKLPASMTLTSLNVSLAAADPAAGTAAGASPLTPIVGPDGKPIDVIGTVTLGGSSKEIDDLASYVASLNKADGVVNVVPTSNGASDEGASAWTVTLQLTEALHTDRYAAESPNGEQ